MAPDMAYAREAMQSFLLCISFDDKALEIVINKAYAQASIS